MLDEQGKVVARRPGVIDSHENLKEAGVLAAMYQEAEQWRMLLALGEISPMIEQILSQHDIRIEDDNSYSQ